ncbi:MAG: ThiF family adenylyltransferase [Planctomycetaceae bacterium]|nr:ThiF family adenylyltransferase [Planctomycetaceae bacterium]
MPVTFAASEVLSRTIAFAQMVRWRCRPPTDDLIDHFLRYRVRITGDPCLLSTEAGQQAIASTANLIVRFCPAVEIDVPAKVPILLDENSLLGGGCLATALESLPQVIWGAQGTRFPGRSKTPNLVVTIGTPPRKVCVPHLQLSFGNWWGGVSDAGDEPPTTPPGNRGLGPLVASCLGASSTFKAVLRMFAEQFPGIASENTHWDLQPRSLCLSLLDYSLSPFDDPTQLGRHLPFPVVFVSAGAICSAVGYGLAANGVSLPAGVVFEPKVIDPPDLNRYMIAASADIDRRKADLLATWLRSSTPVTPRIERFTGDDLRICVGAEAVYVVGVDDIPSRWIAQSSWPRALLVGATEHDQFRVTAHSMPLGHAGCARCVDAGDTQPPSDGIIPAISFVSALVGFAITGELLKLSTADLKRFRLSNMVGGRLLQLCPWNYEVGFVKRTPECQLCRRVA